MQNKGKQVWIKYFLIGLGVLIPVLLSFWIIWYVYTGVDHLLDPILTKVSSLIGIDHNGWHRSISNILTVLLSFLFITLIGRIVKTRIGKWFHRNFDWFLAKINPVYDPIKKTVNLTLESLGSSGGLFSRPVAIKSELVVGGYVMGLLLPECENDFMDPKVPGNTMLTVFIIHGPVGNSGFATIVPKSSVRPIKTSVTGFLTTNNLRFGAGLADLLRKKPRYQLEKADEE